MSDTASPWDQLNDDYKQWAEVLDDAGAGSMFSEAIAGAYDAGKNGATVHPAVHGGVFRDTLARTLAVQGPPNPSARERLPERLALPYESNPEHERNYLVNGLRIIVREAEEFPDQDGVGAGTMARNLLKGVGLS